MAITINEYPDKEQSLYNPPPQKQRTYRIYKMNEIRANIQAIKDFFASMPFSVEDIDVDLEMLDELVKEISDSRRCEYEWQDKHESECYCG